MSPRALLLMLLLAAAQHGVYSAIGNTYYFLAVYDTTNADLVAAAEKAIADMNAATLNVLPSGKSVNLTKILVGSESLFQTVCKSGNEHMLWIDGILDFTSRPSCVDDLAKHLDAPIIRAALDLSSAIANVQPSPRNYMRSVASLLLRDNATRDGVMVLYDTAFDAGSILPYEDYSWYPPIYLRKIPATTAELKTILEEAKLLAVADFVVAASVPNAATAVSQGITVGLMGGIYHWFVITKDFMDFTCSSCSSGNIFYFRQAPATAFAATATAIYASVASSTGSAVSESRKIDVLFAYEAAETLGRTVKAQVDAGSFSNATNFLVCNTLYNASTPVRFNDANTKIKALNFNSVMGAVNFQSTLRNQETTFDIYQYSFPSTSNKIGTWTKAAGLVGSVSSITLDYLTKRTLRVFVVEEPPFVVKKADGTFDGYSVEMLRELAVRLNFNYTVTEQPDGKYGSLQADGTWNGMMGSIEKNLADMAIGPITVTAQRDQVADFTVPTYDYVTLQILIKKPVDTKRGDQTFFLKAFTWEVWVCIIAIITATGFFIFIVDRTSPFSFQNRYKNDQIREGEAEGKVFTIKESLWYVLGAYTQAGESFDPRSMSCRTIVVGFWLFGYLMMSLYTANLAAQLTVSKLAQPPQSFDAMTTQVKMQYTVVKDTASYEHFMRMKDAEANLYNYWLTSGIGTQETVNQVASLETWKYPVIERYTTIWNRMTRWGFVSSTAKALEKVRQDWAIFLESPMVKFYTTQSCDLTTVGEPFAPRPYGIAVKNKSPLLKPLNQAILGLNEGRVTENLKVKWWSQNKASCPAEASSSSGLSLDTLGGAFVFFCIGIVIAVIIFIAEKIVAKVYGVEWAKNNDDAKQNTIMQMLGPSTANLRSSNTSLKRPATAGMPRPVTGHHRPSSGNKRSSVEPAKSMEILELDTNDHNRLKPPTPEV